MWVPTRPRHSLPRSRPPLLHHSSSHAHAPLVVHAMHPVWMFANAYTAHHHDTTRRKRGDRDTTTAEAETEGRRAKTMTHGAHSSIAQTHDIKPNRET